MFENKTQDDARKEILELVKEYHDKFHNIKKEFKEGDRITYASRVYDSEEMVNLVDASLEFWLTAGSPFDDFEKEFGKQLGTKYVSLVNSEILLILRLLWLFVKSIIFGLLRITAMHLEAHIL